MTIDFGQLREAGQAASIRAGRSAVRALPELPAPPSPDPARASAASGLDSVDLSLPSSPPPEVLEAMAEAAARARELAEANRELHFRADEASGRIIVEVRDLGGNVIRTIPPSTALDVMAGLYGAEHWT